MRCRNTSVIARIAPAWITMLKKSERAPSQCWAISRCPVLDTGRNSVSPSRMPSRRADSGSDMDVVRPGVGRITEGPRRDRPRGPGASPRPARQALPRGGRAGLADASPTWCIHHADFTFFVRCSTPVPGGSLRINGLQVDSGWHGACSNGCRPSPTRGRTTMSLENVEKLIKDHKVEFVDLRFVDMRGVQQHVTFPASIVEPGLFEDGKMFDGSSIAGWKGINESDMILLPHASTAYLDPFYADPTLNLTCDILEPATMQPYARDPRGIAKRAEAYLRSSGIADQAFFGPEPEYFIFDSVRFANEMGNTFFHVESEEAAWNSGKDYEGGNSGYRPGVKGGYFPVPPVDSLHDIRAEMVKTLEQIGIEVEVHHHEVATAGQCEIGTKFNSMVKKADELLATKYVVRNVAFRNGKTATFMPKPIVGDNGSGMHVHMSLAKGGQNLFAG